VTATPSRNAPCHCGSGRRYKECHGRTDNDPSSMMTRALRLQSEDSHAEAEQLYRQVLEARPDEPNALHMLGVARMVQGDATGAATSILRALDLTEWSVPGMRHNLAVALARVIDAPIRRMSPSENVRRYRQYLTGRPGPTAVPRISILLPLLAPDVHVGRTIASVLAQSHSDIELVIVARDAPDARDTLREVEAQLRSCPFPSVVRTSGADGVVRLLNEAAEASTGDLLQPLMPGDALHSERLAAMARALPTDGEALAYGGVRALDAEGERVDEFADRRAFAWRCVQAATRWQASVGFDFVARFPAIHPCNLCIARPLFDALGGFDPGVVAFGWVFVLRAIPRTEPHYVEDACYLVAPGATTDALTAFHGDTPRRFLTAFLAGAFGDAPRNPWAPNLASWGDDLFPTLLAYGVGGLVPPDALRDYARATMARGPRGL
jgi:hypothetical protein